LEPIRQHATCFTPSRQFERTGRRVADPNERKIAALEAKIQQKNEVIAELMEERVQSKKATGEP
jgi:hypothetical protein